MRKPAAALFACGAQHLCLCVYLSAYLFTYLYMCVSISPHNYNEGGGVRESLLGNLTLAPPPFMWPGPVWDRKGSAGGVKNVFFSYEKLIFIGVFLAFFLCTL